MPRTITVCDSAPAIGRLPACARQVAYAAPAMAGEQIDFAAEGLLDGLEGEERAERLALLEHLAADGVPLAELRRATATGTLMFLPAERVIAGDERYTAAQVAQLSGVDAEFLVARPPGDGPADPRARRGGLHRRGPRDGAADRTWRARRASPTRRTWSCCACSGAGCRRRRRACARCR